MAGDSIESFPIATVEVSGAGSGRPCSSSKLPAIRLHGLARRAASALLGWHERWRQRERLAILSDHLLKDIGLARMEAEWEWRKPFWRA